jgi:heptosyltransferase II
MAVKYPADRILVRCPNWVGDAVMAGPTLRCLRRSYPDAEITLLTQPYVRKVFDDGPWHNDIIEMRGLPATVRELRKRRFDLALLLVHSFRSALTARMARIPRRIGYTRGDQSLLLTDPIAYPRDGRKFALVPKVDLYARLTEYLGCEGWDNKHQELHYSSAQRSAVHELLIAKGAAPEKPLAALVPGAAYGASKYWPAERFAQVADALARRHGMACVVVASPAERAIVEIIRQKMKSPLISFATGEMDLGLLKPLVAACSLMIATDTGPRHYAVAFNVPVAVLMGATDPRKTDSDYPRTVILRHEVECGPCYKRSCPTDHRCMNLITAKETLAAAEDLLTRYGPPAGWGAKLLSDQGCV